MTARLRSSDARPLIAAGQDVNPELSRLLAIEKDRSHRLREDLEQARTDLAAVYAAAARAGVAGVSDFDGRRTTPTAVDELDLGNYFDQVERNYIPYANPFHHFEQLVDLLEANSRVSIVPCCELMGESSSGVRVSLRSDIDADPITAVRCARLLASRGICGSFYLLHTAIYYGRMFGTLFVRHRELPKWIESLIVAGAEIGLHNDALGAHRLLGVDGPLALAQEIAYVRQLGAQIRGTAGHNSVPVYGAENSEVFAERVLWTSSDAIRHRLPLGVLSEAELGLTYEGTFASPHRHPDSAEASAFAADLAAANIRDPAWMRTYLTKNPCCRWDVDMQIWVVGRDHWVAGGVLGGEPYFRDRLTLADLPSVLTDLPDRSRCLFVLHPEYFRA
jgi:hypothetical protein